MAAPFVLKLNNIDVMKYIKILFIMRGIPGSGKSYTAHNIAAYFENTYQFKPKIFSTDEFFTKDGVYNWVATKVGIAHKWNQNRTYKAMEEGCPVVIVDNTNTTYKEVEPYVREAEKNNYSVIFMESGTDWAKNAEVCAQVNQHKVPRESIDRMLGRWQETDDIIKSLGTGIKGSL